MLPRIARLIIHSLTAISIFVCLSIVQLMSFFFFFSSRRRHTRCSRDWSSDVCSSDLRSGKPVKCLFIDAVSKFLAVDIRSGASLSLRVPKPRGDWQWIGLEGALDDGTKISHRYNKPRWRKKENCTYLISIFESGAAIDPPFDPQELLFSSF